jgi:peptidoglycan hydrolase-like protein with peptidoglycan-binding domain
VAATAVLKLGASGTPVSEWQQQLNTWLARQPGLRPLPVTGRFDQPTVIATTALQNAAGISADGTVGPLTRQALRNALSSSG